jgi:hypothetical protein
LEINETSEPSNDDIFKEVEGLRIEARKKGIIISHLEFNYIRSMQSRNIGKLDEAERSMKIYRSQLTALMKPKQ